MTTVEVLLDAAGVPSLVGQAHFTRERGRLSTTFLYDASYLAGQGTSIDPALPLVAGAQHQTGLVLCVRRQCAGPVGAEPRREGRAVPCAGGRTGAAAAGRP